MFQPFWVRMWHPQSPIAFALWGMFGVLWVFLPTLVATLRRHPNMRTIALINLVFCWEVVLWTPLMAWACFDRQGEVILARFKGFRERIGRRNRDNTR
ncbi:superinfection immunity protein [Asaia sp. VD9]|uniref:superinfection immunity protein n=1 Tax=Asaia sp. VD9 TaxID=3081235 RepID=UPI0038D04B0B